MRLDEAIIAIKKDVDKYMKRISGKKRIGTNIPGGTLFALDALVDAPVFVFSIGDILADDWEIYDCDCIKCIERKLLENNK